MGKYQDLTGRKFTRLLVLEKVENIKRTTFKCLCDCGVEKNIKSESLKDGTTKSCGCLNNEKRSERSFNMYKKNIKYHPQITSARRVFKKRYSDGDLTFDCFLELTNKNCHYCNSAPNNIFNYAKEHGDKSKSSNFAKDNGDFIYNGLDRVNSDLPHNLDNLVTCCKTCNYAKRYLTSDEFKSWIINIYNHMFNK